VIGLTAEKLNRVHGRHCEAGAVDKAGDIAVELNAKKKAKKSSRTAVCRLSQPSLSVTPRRKP